MSQRSFTTCHSLVVMAVAAALGMMGAAPVNAAVPSDVEITTTVPAAPVILPATAGNGEATANWTAPVFDGGSPITQYHVAMVDAATGTKAIAVKDVAATATSLSFAGLPGGVPVRFQVQAENVVGVGPVSATSNAVMPVTKPGVPKIGTATAGVLSAVGRWTTPANGGVAIGRYHVRVVDAATGKRALAVQDVAGNVGSVNISGLARGTAVRFQVVAVNALGASTSSSFSNAVTVRAPAPKSRSGVNTSVQW